jgi:putative addiction module killer protein
MEIRTTVDFDVWLDSLDGTRAQVKVLARIANMARGNVGDAKPVGEGVSESRIHHGPGYRLYFTRVGNTVCLLLMGGDKSTQAWDIRRAKALASTLHDLRRERLQ